MRHRLSFSNVMSCVAVFIALGGSAYAVASIGSGDVRNNSLRSKDIRNDSLRGKDINSSSVGQGKLRGNAKTRWLLLNESGDIEAQSGGFDVLSKPGINDQPASNPNVYIDTGRSLDGRGLSGTIAIQNMVDRTGDGMPDASFEGDVSVGDCGAEVINCVPTGTEDPDVLVVRALDDNTEVASATRRAYVTVTP